MALFYACLLDGFVSDCGEHERKLTQTQMNASNKTQINANFFKSCLESLMLQHGATQEDIAKHCGIAISSVSRWLSGSIPRPTALKELATFFGVTPEYLLCGQDYEPSGKGGPGEKPMYNQSLGARARILHAKDCEEKAKKCREVAFFLRKEADELDERAAWYDERAAAALEEEEDF